MATTATLRELADLVGGSVLGDESIRIGQVAPIDAAREGDITFLANPKYAAKAKATRASAVIVAPGVEVPGLNLLVVKNPYLAFAKVLTHLKVARPEPKGVMEGAWIHPSAILEEDVTVYPGCTIGEGVRVGRGTILYPRVTLYDRVQVGEECVLHAGAIVREECRLGNRVILQPAAVIGSDGFGFAPDGPRYFKIPQVGIVVVEDDVEIGACSCIDRAAMGETRIRRGVKLDNMVQIGHNVTVGEDTVMAAQVGIAGSTVIGNHCTFGGQAGTAGHLRIGDNVMIGGRGGITSHTEGNQVLSGAPAIPHKDWLKASMSFAKLPEMRRELSRLKNQVEALEKLLKEK